MTMLFITVESVSERSITETWPGRISASWSSGRTSPPARSNTLSLLMRQSAFSTASQLSLLSVRFVNFSRWALISRACPRSRISRVSRARLIYAICFSAPFVQVIAAPRGTRELRP